MNEEDYRIRRDEEDAEPERFLSSDAGSRQKTKIPADKEEPREAFERTATAASSSTTSSGESIERQEIGVSRATTHHESAADLERHPTALSRIQTYKSQHDETIGAGMMSRTRTRQSKRPLPNFGAGKPYPAMLPEREEYVVEFDGPSDPLHAQNWPLKKKLPVAMTLAFVTLTAAFGSSIFSAAASSVAEAFGIPREVAILGISLYVLGFATGPLFWAPMSELVSMLTRSHST